MTVSDECALACYEQIASINEAHGVFLVQHLRSRRIFVKKVLTVYNRSVYEYLRDHHIKGTPEVFEVVEDEDRLIVIEEYVSGQTLKSFLDDGNRFSQEQAVLVIEQLCIILRRLHSASPAIIHRDIKPSNIILTSDGEVMLLDMNAARLCRAGQTEDTALIGTVGYAAPEQFGFGPSGVQADIYSVGILLNELLTGVPLKTAAAQGPLGRVIRRCTMMDPKDRYASMDELLNDLAPQEHGKIRAAKTVLPGFRTGNPVHIILAVLGYTLIFWIGLTMTVQDIRSEAALWLERAFFILCALTVVFFSCNYLSVWSRAGIDRIRSPFLKTTAVLAIDAAAVIALMIVMLCIESFL